MRWVCVSALSVWTLAVWIGAAAPALAALSGFHDSGAKIAAILADEAVADELREAPLRGIENTGTTADGADEWTLRTQECDLRVAVTAEPLPEGMVGMVTYSVALLDRCD